MSIGVVSKVLNDKETAISVSDPTRKRIRQAARSLDYVPDARARLLRAKSSPMVGVLVRSLMGTFRSQLLHGLSDGMLRMGKEFLVSIHRGEVKMAAHAIYTFRTYRTCAVLAIGGTDIMTDEITQMLADGRKQCGPTICVSFHSPQPGVPCVGLDIDAMIEEFLDKMVADGRNHVVLACAGPYQQRVSLLTRFPTLAARRHGLSHENIELVVDELRELGTAVARRLVAQSRRFPAGVMVTNDNEAVVIAQALAAAGVRVPEEVAIVGYGNQTISRYATPAVTTLDVLGIIPSMAKQVITLLADLEQGKELQAREYLFKPEWIMRESFSPMESKQGG